MKTLSITTIARQHHMIDATGMTVGRLATRIATLLRGKHKISYTPHVDAGDFVVVDNIDKLKFTGNKLEQKKYWRHSQHPGGIKHSLLKDVVKSNPSWVLKRAVKQMLPDNRLREGMVKRLVIKRVKKEKSDIK